MSNPLTLEKLSQKSWQLLIHIITTIGGCYVMYINGWITNPKSMLNPDPHGIKVSISVTVIYSFQLV